MWRGPGVTVTAPVHVCQESPLLKAPCVVRIIRFTPGLLKETPLITDLKKKKKKSLISDNCFSLKLNTLNADFDSVCEVSGFEFEKFGPICETLGLSG